MALYDSIASALGDYKPGEGEEISLKIKPANLVTGQASNSNQLSSAATAGGGGGNVQGPPTPASGFSGFGQDGSSIVQKPQQLGKNLQLVEPPAGAYTDDVFEAQLAAARHQMNQEYMGILEQLGFVGEDGAFIPGLVEQAAARRRAQLLHDQGLAKDEVTGDARRRGTVFSGRRATLQGQRERPFVQALGALEAETPLALGKLFQQATAIKSQFENQLNMLLAEAAQRQAEAIRANPVKPPVLEEPPPSNVTAGGNAGGGEGNVMADVPSNPLWEFFRPGRFGGPTAGYE